MATVAMGTVFADFTLMGIGSFEKVSFFQENYFIAKTFEILGALLEFLR